MVTAMRCHNYTQSNGDLARLVNLGGIDIIKVPDLIGDSDIKHAPVATMQPERLRAFFPF